MTEINSISSLLVTNRYKTRRFDSPQPGPCLDANGRGFLLDTCLREMCITVDADTSAHVSWISGKSESHVGVDGYRYALEVITGLHSTIPGETNVLGQFKKAWNHFRANGDTVAVRRISPLIHRLINDAREIRRAHLQGIGGASYGTLVRKLLAPRRHQTVLVVGAGDLARSILPYFTEFELGQWNRSPVRGPDRAAGTEFAPERASEAARWADHVILATPASPQHDAEWRARLAETRIETVLHLGYRGGALGEWPGCGRSLDLDDVFELRRRQTHIRLDKLKRARAACGNAASELKPERESVTGGKFAHA